MEKIKKVTLKQDYRTPEHTISAGTEGITYNDEIYMFKHDDVVGGCFYEIDYIKNHPEWFEIEYKQPEIESVEMVIKGTWDENSNEWDFYPLRNSVPISLREDEILKNKEFFRIKLKGENPK